MLYTAGAAAVAILIYIYFKISKKFIITSFHITNLLAVFLIAIFVGLIVCFPKVSYSAALSGVNLWFNIVFPSILPFLIGSELLLGLGFVNFLGAIFEPFMRKVFNVPGVGSFAVAMGFTSGYPTGAKVTTDLRLKGMCTKTEGERLLAFTNNSGPLFIIGAVAVGMFNSAQLGFILALAHYSAAITVGLLFRYYKREKIKPSQNLTSDINILRKAFREMFKARRNDGRNIGTLLGDSVKNAVNLQLMIGGFIIFFSVVIALFNELHVFSTIVSSLSIFTIPLGIDNTTINSVLSGLFEVTLGSKLASTALGPYIHKIIAAAFILGWAGFSIHMQVISIVSKTDISPIPYLFAKFAQGIIAGIYTFIIFGLFIKNDYISTFNINANLDISWKNNLVWSGNYLVITLLILIFLACIIYPIRWSVKKYNIQKN